MAYYVAHFVNLSIYAWKESVFANVLNVHKIKLVNGVVQIYSLNVYHLMRESDLFSPEFCQDKAFSLKKIASGENCNELTG